MSFASFAAVGTAVEGAYFRKEQEFALRKQIEKMVGNGQLPQTALQPQNQNQFAETVSNRFPALADVPVTVLKGSPNGDYVYQHVKGKVPVPKQKMPWSTLGTPVSFGRARWNVGDASIFSVDDGKRLAQTPHKPLTFYERIRLEKQQKASLESPLVQGYRLLPEFTPGRAMFWGTVLAMWGTAAIVMSTAKSLDIHTAAEASDKLHDIVAPMANRLGAALVPLKSMVAATNMRSEQQSELALRLRAKLASPASLQRRAEAEGL